MRVVREAAGSAVAAESRGLPAGAVVTVGNYDGVHRGQRTVLESVVAHARALARPAVAVTFEPHPLAILDPARAPQRIASDRQRDALLAGLGLDLLWVLNFDAEFAALPAEQFVRQFLVERLAAREVHVGSRFTFGRGRAGTLAELRRLGSALGFDTVGVAEIEDAGEPISSTRIRTALAAGAVETAANLLGRPFARGGTIVAGDRLGHQIGFPTANLAADMPLLPGNGVYAAKLLRSPSGAELPGAANVGVRPTIAGGATPRIEIHLLDFDGDLYGEEVEVAFWSRIRDERRFEGLDALRDQIGRDVAVAREYFAAEGR